MLAGFCPRIFADETQISITFSRARLQGLRTIADLDRAGRAHALVGVERVSFTRVEVLREETDFAFERCDDRLYPIVEGLCCY